MTQLLAFLLGYALCKIVNRAALNRYGRIRAENELLKKKVSFYQKLLTMYRVKAIQSGKK